MMNFKRKKSKNIYKYIKIQKKINKINNLKIKYN